MHQDTDLKNYEFDEQLLKNIELFDEVLKELGEPPLLENQNFKPFLDFAIVEQCLVLEVISKKQNIIPITIWFEVNDLRIDIDGIPETFVWAKKHIEKDRNAAKELIRNLFTGYILIDYRGSTARFVQIFESDGNFAMSFSRNVMFHLFSRYLHRQKDFRKLFLPIFEKLK